MSKTPKRKARMPWHGDINHTQLPDGRVVLRGSDEHARYIAELPFYSPPAEVRWVTGWERAE